MHTGLLSIYQVPIARSWQKRRGQVPSTYPLKLIKLMLCMLLLLAKHAADGAFLVNAPDGLAQQISNS